MTLPRSLRGLFAMLFVEIFGASLTIPIFTYFCINELKLNATYVGVIMSMFSAAQLLGAPVVGRLSDSCGRRAAMLGCFFWTSLCFAVTSTVRTYSGLLIIRTLAGLSGGSIPVTHAMVMDATPVEKRPKVLGFMGGLLGVAFTFGPGVITVVLFFWHIERRWVFLASALFALVGCIVGYFVLEETLPAERRRRSFWSSGESAPEGAEEGVSREGKHLWHDVWECSTMSMLCIFMGRFCASFAQLVLFSTYAFLIRDAFSWGDRELGMVLASGGLLGAAVQLVAYPALSQALGKHMVFVLGSALVSTYFLLLPVVTLEHRHIGLHLLVKSLFVCGCGIMDPGIPDLAAHHAPADHMGLVHGMSNAFRSLASVAAPLAAGRAYDVSPYVGYAMASMVAIVGGVCVASAPLLDTKHHESDLHGRMAFLAEKFAGKLERGETESLLSK
jgi:DHA1 family tetracycline resistance protein-like MFS transporter